MWPQYNHVSYCTDRRRWFVEIQTVDGRSYNASFAGKANAEKAANLKAAEFGIGTLRTTGTTYLGDIS